MRRLWTSALTLSLLAGPVAAQDASTTLPRLLVFDLRAERGVEPSLAATLEEILLARVRRTGRFQVGSQSEIQTLLSAQAQQQLAGCSDATCLQEIGDSLGAEWMITGSVSRIGEDVVLTLKLFDVAQSRVSRQLTEQIPADESKLAEATESAAGLLLLPPLDRPLEEVRPQVTHWYQSGWLYGGVGVAVAAGVASFFLFRPASLDGNLGTVTLDGP